MLLFSSSQHIIISNTVLANIFKILDLTSSVLQVSSNLFAVHVCNHDSLEIHIVYIWSMFLSTNGSALPIFRH